MGANGRSDAAANITYAKFLFLLPHADDAATLTKIRGAGANISRIFFNDYDADGTRDPQPQETIQFLSADTTAAHAQGIGAARFIAHVPANHRPRLDEVANELTRRVNGAAEVIVLDGAERMPRYTGAEMQKFAYKPALARQSGRVARNCVIVPMNKTAAWWEKSALEWHA